MPLAHELLGAGPDMVLLHGITESRHSWDPLLAPLAAHHRILALDLPGHGESQKADAYDPLSLAAAVHDTVLAAGMTEPWLVGHSLGGVVASAYAAAYPTRGVVNVDQPLQLTAFQAGLQSAAPLLRGTTEEFTAVIGALFASMDGPLPAAERARISAGARPDQAVVLGIWGVVLDSTSAELDATVDALAGAVTVPYLALHGIDPGPEYPGWLAARIPHAEFELWPDHGHYPHLVDPDRFLARVAAFTSQR